NNEPTMLRNNEPKLDRWSKAQMNRSSMMAKLKTLLKNIFCHRIIILQICMLIFTSWDILDRKTFEGSFQPSNCIEISFKLRISFSFIKSKLRRQSILGHANLPKISKCFLQISNVVFLLGALHYDIINISWASADQPKQPSLFCTYTPLRPPPPSLPRSSSPSMSVRPFPALSQADSLLLATTHTPFCSRYSPDCRGRGVDPTSRVKRNTKGGKQNASLKKAKKDKLVGATGKNVRTETSMVSVTLRVKLELTLPATPIEVEQSILEELRNRAQLNNVALPSISFYTFLNTHNGLNCSSISHDGSLVVGGFSDSSVWDMSKIGQPAKISSSQNENGCSHGEHISTLDEGKRTYTLFQGHSGPVYSAAFRPFRDLLLSSSSDLTIRLWSTKLNANLVCYKGHNYPVWDVQFSPVGHYFASASHDRTARIWSIDKIQPLRIMAGHLSDVDCVQWHVNCNYIATGSSDKTVRLWDAQTGECIRMFIGHRSMVLSLAMSPDGRYMTSGDEYGTIMIWDLSTGRSLLASGSADCTVKLWDVVFSIKALKTEDTKGSSSANRLRLLKSLPTKSAPVYSPRVR
ncbi:hypothetical protein ACJX0J_041510, partial [Zea mays]